MRKRNLLLLLAVWMMVGLAGCGKSENHETEDIVIVSDGADKAVKSHKKEYTYIPPKGSHRDSRGYYVDPEGNTFDQDGGWQVPEGGHTDSQGRIYDKNGNLMGGGARVGGKG